MYAYKCMLTMYYAYNVLNNVYLQDPGKCNNNYAYNDLGHDKSMLTSPDKYNYA